MYDGAQGRASECAAIMRMLLKNHLVAEALEAHAPDLLPLAKSERREFERLQRVTDQIREGVTALKQRHHHQHEWVASQVICTLIAPLAGGSRTSYFKWVISTFGCGRKALVSGQQRLQVLREEQIEDLTEKDGTILQQARGQYESGVWFDERRQLGAAVKERKYPQLYRWVLTTICTEKYTTTQADMKDPVPNHVKGDNTHYYDMEGRRRVRRHCTSGMVTATDTESLIEAIIRHGEHGTGERRCMEAPVRTKKASDKELFAMLQEDLRVSPLAELSDVLTFSFFVKCLPWVVQPKKRATSLCVHHLDAQHLGEDAKRNRSYDARAERPAADTVPTDRVLVKVDLHHYCGKQDPNDQTKPDPRGCTTCPQCITGRCRETHPFLGTEHKDLAPMQHLSLARELLLCPKEGQGDRRTHLCLTGKCLRCLPNPDPDPDPHPDLDPDPDPDPDPSPRPPAPALLP